MTKKNAARFSTTQWIFMFVLSLGLIILAVVYSDKLAELKSLGLFGIFLINFFGHATLFLPAPAIASVVVGGAVFPPVSVALVSALGSSLGDLPGFFLGLSSNKVLFDQKNALNHSIVQALHKYGGIVIFIAALIPNPLFDFFSITAGVLSYSPYKYFGWLFAGRLVRDILLAFAGSKLA